VLAASAPGDCFDMVREAVRIATRYMTPVILLSDGYIANASGPWSIPEVSSFERRSVETGRVPKDFAPYRHDETSLARPWVVPGSPGGMHRIGGIERKDGSGNVSYDPVNHQLMTDLRARKIAGIADDIPAQTVEWGEDSGELAILGWGSTYGAINRAVMNLNERGVAVSHIHLKYIWPLPRNLGELLGRFDQVLIPEMNNGQLATLIRSQLLLPVNSLDKVAGKPFKVSEIEAAAMKLVGDGGK